MSKNTSQTSCTRVRSNKSQINLIISFMERNPLFAKNQIDDQDFCNEQWDELKENLNAIGTERKTVAAWKQVWADQVCGARNKRSDFNAGRKSTCPTEVDKRILVAMGDISKDTDVTVRPRPPSPPLLMLGPSSSSVGRLSSKRDIDLTDMEETVRKKLKKTDETPTLQLVEEQNTIMSTLSKHLVNSFNEQTRVMENGFRMINSNIEKLISSIELCYLQKRNDIDNQQFEQGDDGQIPENGDDEANNENEEWPVEFLDPHFDI